MKGSESTGQPRAAGINSPTSSPHYRPFIISHWSSNSVHIQCCSTKIHSERHNNSFPHKSHVSTNIQNSLFYHQTQSTLGHVKTQAESKNSKQSYPSQLSPTQDLSTTSEGEVNKWVTTMSVNTSQQLPVTNTITVQTYCENNNWCKTGRPIKTRVQNSTGPMFRWPQSW